MPPQNRRKNSSVIAWLEAQPGDFTFVQAMRLLERAAVFLHHSSGKNQQSHLPIGRFAPPHREFVRISAHQTLGFPSGELFRIENKPLGAQQLRWLVVINFLGLTGAIGVLPFHYSELVFERLKLRDESIKQFFDLFNHRTASLFYQASIKYRLPLTYERHQLTRPRKNDYDSITHSLLSLIGMSTPHLANQSRIHHLSLLRYAGLFTQRVRTASGLKHMLASYFNVPVQVQEFVGQWHDLIDDVRSRLPDSQNRKGQNACLGKSALIGSKGWFAQGKVRIVLGPLNKEEFYRFAPGTAALACLHELVKFYAGMEQDFEYVISVSRKHLPSKIQLNKNNPPIIGWDSWLATQPLAAYRHGETLNIAISSRRLG
jgi:type VI secretion system protein ImpH